MSYSSKTDAQTSAMIKVDAQAPEIIMYSATWCSDCRRSRKFLDSLGVTYVEIDIEQDPEAEALVIKLNDGNRSIPTIIFPDGSFLTEPSNVTLEGKLDALGITTPTPALVESTTAAIPVAAETLPAPVPAPAPALVAKSAPEANPEPSGAALWIGPLVLTLVLLIALAVVLWMRAGSPLPWQ
jgi:mycoredoxin